MFLSACAGSNQVAIESPFPEPPPLRETVADYSIPSVEAVLRLELASWEGTPHLYGGTTGEGIDCSAFVQQVFSRAFNMNLPRTTREQAQAGRAVSRVDLTPGDLVFFTPPSKSRHVGIYLNNGEFVHASSSQGVMVSSIDQDYWRDAYWTSRRVLPEPSRRAVADRTRVIGSPLPSPVQELEPASEEPRRGRVGW